MYEKAKWRKAKISNAKCSFNFDHVCFSVTYSSVLLIYVIIHCRHQLSQKNETENKRATMSLDKHNTILFTVIEGYAHTFNATNKNFTRT